jgi:hypothetical protein
MAAGHWLADRSGWNDDHLTGFVAELQDTWDALPLLQEDRAEIPGGNDDEPGEEGCDETVRGPDNPADRRHRKAGYVVAAQPRQIFRLRRSDAGGTSREKIFKAATEYESRPPPESYTPGRKLCWPGGGWEQESQKGGPRTRSPPQFGRRGSVQGGRGRDRPGRNPRPCFRRRGVRDPGERQVRRMPERSAHRVGR